MPLPGCPIHSYAAAFPITALHRLALPSPGHPLQPITMPLRCISFPRRSYPWLRISSPFDASPCHRSANHPAHLRSNPLLRGLRRPCPSIAKLLRSLPYHAVATHPGSCPFPCRAFRRLSQPLHSVSALRAAIRRPGPLRFASAVRCFALSLPRLTELCPSLALLGPAHPLPAQNFAFLRLSMAGQCLADPWPRAPRRANPSQCISLLFLCDAMPICSIASRIEAVQIRLPSPPAESPRPNAAADQGCAFPLRRVQFSAMPTQCHAHLPIAIPSRPGGASHRSSRIS